MLSTTCISIPEKFFPGKLSLPVVTIPSRPLPLSPFPSPFLSLRRPGSNEITVNKTPR